MKIVIEIDDEIYDYITKEYTCMRVKDGHAVAVAIANGTPLPKGHGRLIDADALMEYCQNDKSKVIDCNDIARFPTIIRREE